MTPILVGMVVDMLDLATLGPLGVMWGWLIGGVGTYVVATLNKVPPKPKLFWSVVVGLYCSIPGTSFLPVATVMMTLWKWLGHKPKQP
ncbi:MAG: hypothetical protein KDC35_20425 [Acidobacteria bacterium]|nr:hypothetical protein [Acidobacteriota bacterium]